MTLIQSDDAARDEDADWRVVTKRAPTQSELNDLKFAWTAVRYVKSNAIVLCKEEATVGVGAGQMNRLQSVKLAVEQAGQKVRARFGVDAFFLLLMVTSSCISRDYRRDSTGGSIRDDEVIEAADAEGLNDLYRKTTF